MLPAILVVLGFGGAFLSGFAGVGGAIVMIPLLLYVPPLLGFPVLGIKVVAGITMVQVFAASLVGLTRHRARIDRHLFVALGPAMVLASFVGAYVSGAVPAVVLEIVFASLASGAAILMIVSPQNVALEPDGTPQFDVRLAAAAGLGVGFAAGLIGAGGAFVLIPVMLYGLRIPVRVTVGTSLAVVAAGAAAGLIGKVAAAQVDWTLAIPLVLGALPGAWLGSMVSKRTSTRRLVGVLGAVIALVATRMWIEVLVI
jgi:uncharacterized membrane protein YfcA